MQLKKELEYIEYSMNGMFKDINVLLSEYLRLLREASVTNVNEKKSLPVPKKKLTRPERPVGKIKNKKITKM